MVDFLIVGGGIAGINVAWQLHQRGTGFHLIDTCQYKSATSIAAGLINPVTGRKFSTQWNIDELIPLAEKTYTEIGHFLHSDFLFKKSIFKIHKNESVVEDWLKIKSAQPVSAYINAFPDSTSYAKYLDFRFGAIGVYPAFHLNMVLLQQQFYAAFSNSILKEQLEYDTLKIEPNGINYKGNIYRNIIFCDGVAAQKNPWFNFISFKPAKGECLIIEVPNMQLHEIIMKGVILVPISTNTFWVGATNTWNDLSNEPTQAAFEELDKGLKELLKIPYQVVAHKAAVRPTIKDRTPVVGRHPEIENMYTLNGLGTKGTSLAPYYAKQLIDHILTGTPINHEVRVNRF